MLGSITVEQGDLKAQENKEGEFAHYSESTSVVEGYILGTPVTALCGEIFIPSKNPERLKLCPSCKEIMDLIFLSSE